MRCSNYRQQTCNLLLFFFVCLFFFFNVRDLLALKAPLAILAEQAEGYEYSIAFVTVVSGLAR